MQAGSQPEIKAMVDSLQLAGDGKNVSLSFTVPTELFDALEAMKKAAARHVSRSGDLVISRSGQQIQLRQSLATSPASQIARSPHLADRQM